MSSQTTTPSPHLAAAERASVLYGSDGMNSADPKPRLRWTPELHERFVDAVTQLGGADSKPPSAALLPSFSFVLHYFLVPTPSILAAPRQGSVPFFSFAARCLSCLDAQSSTCSPLALYLSLSLSRLRWSTSIGASASGFQGICKHVRNPWSYCFWIFEHLQAFEKSMEHLQACQKFMELQIHERTKKRTAAEKINPSQIHPKNFKELWH